MACLWSLVLGVAALLSSVAGIALPLRSETVACHVCGPAAAPALHSPFPGQPPPPDCREDAEQLPATATRECPPDYKSCLTTYNGTEVTRTCEKDQFQGCEMANRVVYCYCSSPLCNSQTEAQMRQELDLQLQSREGSGAGGQEDDLEDDEDLDESTSRSSAATDTTTTTSTTWRSSTTTGSATSTTTQGDFYLSSSPEQDTPGASKDAASSPTTADSEGGAEAGAGAGAAAEEAGGGKGSGRRERGAGLAAVLAATLCVLVLSTRTP